MIPKNDKLYYVIIFFFLVSFIYEIVSKRQPTLANVFLYFAYHHVLASLTTLINTSRVPVVPTRVSKMATPKNGQTEHGSIEIYFAKKLANNDKKVRDRAVKRMRIWLSSRPGESFDDLDMMKLWKGLFYCMWFSDKPLVQEDLANSLAKLIHSLKDIAAVCKFISAFFLTMGREWHGIDRLRLDKFYMLIRRVLREIFGYLQEKSWVDEHVVGVSAALLNGPCSSKMAFPDGVRMFVTEIFAGELIKQVKEIKEPKPGLKALTTLFDPFIVLFAHTGNSLVSGAVNDSVFKALMPRKEGGNPKLQIDLEKFGSRFFEEGTKDNGTTKKRKSLFRLSKLFKDAAEAKALKENSMSNEEDKENEDTGEVKKLKKKAKKRKSEKNDKSVKESKRKKKLRNEDNEKEKEITEFNDADKSTIAHNELSGNESSIVTHSADSQISSEELIKVTCKDNDSDPIRQKLDFETSIEIKGSSKVEKKKSKKLKKSKADRKSKIENVSDIKKTPDNVTGKDINDVEMKRDQNDKTSFVADQVVNEVEMENKDISKDEDVQTNESTTETKEKARKIKKGSKTLDMKRTKRKTRQGRKSVQSIDGESSAKKKVVFELDKNAITSISNLKINPAKVFTPDQKPAKGVLKTPTPRRHASNFF